ncbi:MAG: ribonuclease III [Oscillospiraceae bacterium]|jgi:ribonuclease-3|nr:ribonuclease III [Oscillospiraceae bacterium]
MNALQNALGYQFKNVALLEHALTHSSYAHEVGDVRGSNERLEFLGDSVLGFLSAEYFYQRYPSLPEGELTKRRAHAVCEGALFAYANSFGLGEYLRLGKGEQATGGRTRPSIVSDAFEAVLAAIYLDGGIAPARAHVLRFLKDERFGQVSTKDSKTLLQEIIQRTPGLAPEYVLVSEEGPAHERLFTVEVFCGGRALGRGAAHSKKRAEQRAAAEALAQLAAQ